MRITYLNTVCGREDRNSASVRGSIILYCWCSNIFIKLKRIILGILASPLPKKNLITWKFYLGDHGQKCCNSWWYFTAMLSWIFVREQQNQMILRTPKDYTCKRQELWNLNNNNKKKRGGMLFLWEEQTHLLPLLSL